MMKVRGDDVNPCSVKQVEERCGIRATGVANQNWPSGRDQFPLGEMALEPLQEHTSKCTGGLERERQSEQASEPIKHGIHGQRARHHVQHPAV